jgi:hypothetical protein
MDLDKKVTKDRVENARPKWKRLNSVQTTWAWPSQTPPSLVLLHLLGMNTSMDPYYHNERGETACRYAGTEKRNGLYFKSLLKMNNSVMLKASGTKSDFALVSKRV